MNYGFITAWKSRFKFGILPLFVAPPVYGQATQDGCSLALCPSPTWPMPASPTPTHIIDLPTYLPWALASDSLSKGRWGACPYAGFPGNQWAHPTSNPPITGNLPFPQEQRPRPGPARCLPHTVESRCRTLLQTCQLPFPVNHPCSCCWLQALSLVLKLAKCRPCRCRGCNPTQWKHQDTGGAPLPPVWALLFSPTPNSWRLWLVHPRLWPPRASGATLGHSHGSGCEQSVCCLGGGAGWQGGPLSCAGLEMHIIHLDGTLQGLWGPDLIKEVWAWGGSGTPRPKGVVCIMWEEVLSGKGPRSPRGPGGWRKGEYLWPG